MAAFEAAVEQALEYVEVMKVLRPWIAQMDATTDPGILTYWDEQIAQKERPS